MESSSVSVESLANKLRGDSDAWKNARIEYDTIKSVSFEEIESSSKDILDFTNVVTNSCNFLEDILGCGVQAMCSDRFVIDYNLRANIERTAEYSPETKGLSFEVNWKKENVQVGTHNSSGRPVALEKDLQAMIIEGRIKNLEKFASCTGLGYNDVKNIYSHRALELLRIFQIGSATQSKLARLVKGCLIYFDLIDGDKTKTIPRFEPNMLQYSVDGLINSAVLLDTAYVYTHDMGSGGYSAFLYSMCQAYPHPVLGGLDHIRIPADADSIYLVTHQPGPLCLLNVELNAYIVWGSLVTYANEFGLGGELEKAVIIAASLRENRYMRIATLPTVISECDRIAPTLVKNIDIGEGRPQINIEACTILGRMHQMMCLCLFKDIDISTQLTSIDRDYSIPTIKSELSRNAMYFLDYIERMVGTDLFKLSYDLSWLSYLDDNEIVRLRNFSAFEGLWIVRNPKYVLENGMVWCLKKGIKNEIELKKVHVYMDTHSILTDEMRKAGYSGNLSVPNGGFNIRLACIRAGKRIVKKPTFGKKGKMNPMGSTPTRPCPGPFYGRELTHKTDDGWDIKLDEVEAAQSNPEPVVVAGGSGTVFSVDGRGVVHTNTPTPTFNPGFNPPITTFNPGSNYTRPIVSVKEHPLSGVFPGSGNGGFIDPQALGYDNIYQRGAFNFMPLGPNLGPRAMDWNSQNSMRGNFTQFSGIFPSGGVRPGGDFRPSHGFNSGIGRGSSPSIFNNSERPRVNFQNFGNRNSGYRPRPGPVFGTGPPVSSTTGPTPSVSVSPSVSTAQSGPAGSSNFTVSTGPGYVATGMPGFSTALASGIAASSGGGFKTSIPRPVTPVVTAGPSQTATTGTGELDPEGKPWHMSTMSRPTDTISGSRYAPLNWADVGDDDRAFVKPPVDSSVKADVDILAGGNLVLSYLLATTDGELASTAIELKHILTDAVPPAMADSSLKVLSEDRALQLIISTEVSYSSAVFTNEIIDFPPYLQEVVSYFRMCIIKNSKLADRLDNLGLDRTKLSQEEIDALVPSALDISNSIKGTYLDKEWQMNHTNIFNVDGGKRAIKDKDFKKLWNFLENRGSPTVFSTLWKTIGNNELLWKMRWWELSPQQTLQICRDFSNSKNRYVCDDIKRKTGQLLRSDSFEMSNDRKTFPSSDWNNAVRSIGGLGYKSRLFLVQLYASGKAIIDPIWYVVCFEFYNMPEIYSSAIKVMLDKM